MHPARLHRRRHQPADASQFVESESTFDYFVATRAYLERYGKPVAFYSDKHSVFRVNSKDAVGGAGMTQFGRALHALNIDIICANSSQAKGRVERANGTLQDRLVKEMRLDGIDTIAAGNAFLPAFMEKYNARFAKVPFDDRDVHRPLAGHDDLDDAFAWKEERTVSMNLTLQYDQVLFILEPTGIARSLARKRVMVLAEDSMPEMARNLRAIRLFVWCSRIVETEPGLKRFERPVHGVRCARRKRNVPIADLSGSRRRFRQAWPQRRRRARQPDRFGRRPLCSE
jgi:hypothetical protein